MAEFALRVETDIERSMAQGIAPARSEQPHDREGLLLPLTLRERALVCAVDAALRKLHTYDGSEQDVVRIVGAMKTLETVFGAATGCVWDSTPW